MTDHFPLMVPGSKTASPRREVSAPYDGTLLATVDTADPDVAERALATAYALSESGCLASASHAGRHPTQCREAYAGPRRISRAERRPRRWQTPDGLAG